MKINVKKVNAFTETINGGNPAGVLLDSPDLTEEQMKHVSKKLAVSETAFVFPSEKADYKTRFFSPKVEVDLCGHATIATFFTMAKHGFFPHDKNICVTQETKTGILPVNIYFTDKEEIERVMMTQGKPVLRNVEYDMHEIANSLNINVEEFNDSLPKQVVSTGLFTLPLCINSFDILKNIKPDFGEVKKICTLLGIGSFHLFTFDTIEPDSAYHARNFAPLYGINEDPVTGTANGAVSNYLVKNKIIKERNIICEQGDIIGRSGRVFVEIDEDTIRVGGKARVVEEREIEL